MVLKTSQIEFLTMTFELPPRMDVRIPSEEDLIEPLEKVINELDLFDFMEKHSLAAIIGLKRGRSTRAFSPIEFFKEFAEELPFVSFGDEDGIMKISISVKEFQFSYNFEKEEETEKEEKDKGNKETTLFTEKTEKDRLVSGLKTLLGVLYSRELLNKEEPEIPVRINCSYRIESEESKSILSSLERRLECDLEDLNIKLMKTDIKFEITPDHWTRLLIEPKYPKSEDMKGKEVEIVLKSTHADKVSLKEIKIEDLVELNMNQTSLYLEELGK